MAVVRTINTPSVAESSPLQRVEDHHSKVTPNKAKTDVEKRQRFRQRTRKSRRISNTVISVNIHDSTIFPSLPTPSSGSLFSPTLPSTRDTHSSSISSSLFVEFSRNIRGYNCITTEVRQCPQVTQAIDQSTISTPCVHRGSMDFSQAVQNTNPFGRFKLIGQKTRETSVVCRPIKHDIVKISYQVIVPFNGAVAKPVIRKNRSLRRPLRMVRISKTRGLFVENSNPAPSFSPHLMSSLRYNSTEFDVPRTQLTSLTCPSGTH